MFSVSATCESEALRRSAWIAERMLWTRRAAPAVAHALQQRAVDLNELPHHLPELRPAAAGSIELQVQVSLQAVFHAQPGT